MQLCRLLVLLSAPTLSAKYRLRFIAGSLTRRRVYLAIVGAVILISLFWVSQDERLVSVIGNDTLNILQKSDTSPIWRQELRQQLAASNITVVALLFYGRKESVSILNSYIEVSWPCSQLALLRLLIYFVTLTAKLASQRWCPRASRICVPDKRYS